MRGGIDAFYRQRQQGGEKPSPSRLRRATSPERERLWQRRKAYRLSADFFQPLANEDETCPLCQGLSPSGELSSAARLRGFVPESTLSVTASPCHLPRRWRLWQGRKVYRLTAGFFLPLTGEDETCPLCQGLSLSGELSPQATERVRPGSNPLRHGFAVPPPPKVEALAEAESLPLIG